MASRMFIVILLFAASAVAFDYKVLDEMLFSPFCRSKSINSILKVCAPPVAFKADNTFGVDFYSTYDPTKNGGTPGKVATPPLLDGAEPLLTVFTIAVPNRDVKCTVRNVNGQPPVVEIEKFEVSSGSNKKFDFGNGLGNAEQYTDPIQDGVGVTIKVLVTENNEVECEW